MATTGRHWLGALLLLCLSACRERDAATLPLRDSGNSPTSPAAIRNVQNFVDPDDPAHWPLHGRTQAEQRFSPLSSIDRTSIARLGIAWSIDLPDERGMQATPLIVDGRLLVSTSWSRVLALDPATGKRLWDFDPQVSRGWLVNACCDAVNRGVAHDDGEIFLATLDGRLIALDASSGTKRWETLVIDRSERASVTGAPRVIDGRVYIGSAGGAFGIRGRLTAVDAKTGAILWRFFTVPGDPGAEPENRHLPQAVSTWSGGGWKSGGGGAVWDAMAYDPALDLLYIGTGNGSPLPQAARSADGGDNLYVSSILAIRPRTGELVWHYQTTPGDEWGYDAASQLVLAELFMDGRLRHVVLQAAANGFLYVLDRASGELISATAFAPTTWASAIDLQTGRPKEHPKARYGKTGKPFLARPSPRGAHSWEPMAFDPTSGLLYIPAMLNAAQLRVDRSRVGSRYAENGGVAVLAAQGTQPDSSRLIAWDVAAAKPRWQQDSPSPLPGGLLATGGDLVFQGGSDGSLHAYDAQTGEPLGSSPVGAQVRAAPVTYAVEDRQFVLVVAGTSLDDAARSPQLDPAATGSSRVVAFALDGRGTLPPPSPPIRRRPGALILTGPTPDAARGSALYERYCRRCHGADGASAPSIQDLRTSPRLSNPDAWANVVFAGALASTGMPGFQLELTRSDVEAIRHGILERLGAGPPGR